MEKLAPTDHDVHDLIRKRWSPRAFSPAPVTDAALRSLMEAARWSASCANEQPWHFIVARREDEADFGRMLACLLPGNQRWVKDAPVLMLSVARLRFAKSGELNRHSFHDVGLATAQLALQATSMGMAIHPMAGFSPELARQTYGIPEDHEAVAAIAAGYLGDPNTLPEDLKKRELAARSRRPQTDFVFAKAWATPY